MDSQTRKTHQKIYEWAEHAERPGGELDWFAVDSDGFLAAFATAGFGPIPDDFFKMGLSSYMALVEIIEDKFDGSDSIHSGGFLPYSQRGFHAYDFQASESGQYEIEVVPEKPLKIEKAKELGINRNMLVEFPGRFLESRLVVPEEYWQCR